jgi:hypothetical protein
MLEYINKLIIVICLVMFIVLIATYIELYTKFDYKYTKINIDDIYDMIETGDVIYFSYANFIKPYFSHVALAIVDDKDNKYILEINGENNRRVYTSNKGGVSFSSLKTRLMTFKIGEPSCDIYLLKLRNDKVPTLETTLGFINKITNYKNTYQYNNKFINKIIFDCTRKKLLDMKVNDKRYGDNNLICSEFIMLCLMDLGIIQHDNISCKTPEEFLMLKDNNKKLYDKNYYVILDK